VENQVVQEHQEKVVHQELVENQVVQELVEVAVMVLIGLDNGIHYHHMGQMMLYIILVVVILR
jgi:hypothetical protein